LLTGCNYIVLKEQSALWSLCVAGPETSPFEGGTFQIAIGLDNFPYSGPTITFRTKIYHPDINAVGVVAPSAIQTSKQWNPSTNLLQVINTILAIMITPCMTIDPNYNREASNSYSQNQWDAIAR